MKTVRFSIRSRNTCIEHETITGKEFMKIFRELKGIPEPGQETEAAVSDDMFVDDEV